MIRIEFTDQQIEDLNDERYHHPEYNRKWKSCT